MSVPRNPWVAVQAAHFDRWITEHPEVYEGDAYWDWARDQFVTYTLPFLPSGAAVLDVGCGDGYVAHRLAECPRIRHVTAIDASPASIAYAQQRYSSPKLTCTCAAFEEWVTGAQFDVVVLRETIEHFGDAERALRTIAQFLRPGGVLCVSTPNRLRLENVIRRCIGVRPVLVDPLHAREFSRGELERLAALVGFLVVARRSHTAWAEWAFAPLFPFRRARAIDAFLRSDFAKGKHRWNYHLGRLLGPFGGTLQYILRKT